VRKPGPVESGFKKIAPSTSPGSRQNYNRSRLVARRQKESSQSVEIALAMEIEELVLRSLALESEALNGCLLSGVLTVQKRNPQPAAAVTAGSSWSASVAQGGGRVASGK
jgi:hypothetical protein